MFSYGPIVHSDLPFSSFFLCLDNLLLASCRYLMSSFAFFNLIDLLLGIEDIVGFFFIQTYVCYAFNFNRLSTSSETEEGEDINKTKSNQETLLAPFFLHGFLLLLPRATEMSSFRNTPSPYERTSLPKN